MKIQEALKPTGKATIGGTENHWHIQWDSVENRFYKTHENGKIEKYKIRLKALMRDDWQPYHEVKEIRPEKAGELWLSNNDTIFFTYRKCSEIFFIHRDGSGQEAVSIKNDGEIVHGECWTRLYPPVEDKSIERIEIEVKLKQIPASDYVGLLTVIDDGKSYIYNPLSNIKRNDLLDKPMKMILEIPKVDK